MDTLYLIHCSFAISNLIILCIFDIFIEKKVKIKLICQF